VLVARNMPKLLQIKQELETAFAVKVEVVGLDLTETDSATTLFEELQRRKITVDILCNNAGYGDNCLFAQCDIKKNEGMLSLNIVALTNLTRLFLPEMLKRGTGKILNTASIAAYFAGGNMATYCATKAYVLSLTNAIACELRGTGVTVTALCPGPTESGFWAGAAMTGNRFLQRFPLPPATDVAAAAYRAMMRGRPTVIPCWWNKVGVGLMRLLPRGWVTRIATSLMAKN